MNDGRRYLLTDLFKKFFLYSFNFTSITEYLVKLDMDILTIFRTNGRKIGIDVSRGDKIDKRTALHFAAMHGNHDVCKLLLQNKYYTIEGEEKESKERKGIDKADKHGVSYFNLLTVRTNF